MSLIPTLRTERLVLRPPVISDFPEYAALMASERAVFMGGPFDERAAWGMFSSDVAMWPLYGHGALMIDVASTGNALGRLASIMVRSFRRKSWDGSLMTGTKGRASRPKLAKPCVTGHSVRSDLKHW